jgi:hypothetical protein
MLRSETYDDKSLERRAQHGRCECALVLDNTDIETDCATSNLGTRDDEYVAS